MAFDVEGARKAGYSEAEIADHLAATRNLDTAAARKGGYSDAELISHLSAAPPSMSLDEIAANADVPGAQQGTDTQVRERVAASRPGWQPAIDTVSRVGEAAVEGWRGPPFLTKEAKAEAEAENQKTWVGRNVVSPLVATSELPFRALNALGGGIGQAVYEGGAALGGPEAGRDAFMLNQLLPFLAPGMHPGLPREGPAPLRPRGPAQTAEVYPPRAEPMAPAPAFVPPDAPLPPQRLVTPALSEPPEPPAFVPPDTSAANVNLPGENRSVGAQATPPHLARMDFDETKAARSDAEWRFLMEPTKKGDANIYVEGVTPTRSEIEQSAPKSTEAKVLRQEFREPYSDAEKAKMETIRNKLDDLADTKTVVNSMEKNRDAVAEKQRQAIWDQGGNVDLQPMLDYEQTVLKGEDGRRPVVRRAMREANAEAIMDDQIVSDPKLAYGVRKNINDMIDKLDPLGKPEHARAMGHLIELRNVLDGQMEAAFPGQWKAYLDDYHQASKPIDRRKFLQEEVAKLTAGPDRNITFFKFDKFMKDIAIERAQKGLNRAESLDEETLKTLQGVWKHLQRSASDQELAKVNGSDTTQRMMELLRSGVLHTAAGLTTGGTANVAVPFITRQINRATGERRVRRDLNPDLSKYGPPPNDLTP